MLLLLLSGMQARGTSILCVHAKLQYSFLCSYTRIDESAWDNMGRNYRTARVAMYGLVLDYQPSTYIRLQVYSAPQQHRFEALGETDIVVSFPFLVGLSSVLYLPSLCTLVVYQRGT